MVRSCCEHGGLNRHVFNAFRSDWPIFSININIIVKPKSFSKIKLGDRDETSRVFFLTGSGFISESTIWFYFGGNNLVLF